MTKKQFEQYLSRRIFSNETGWTYFCRICGEYKPETDFYKSQQGKWGLDTRCKIHYKKTKEDVDPEMDYLKLDPITEDDFVQAQLLLQRLGYKFGEGETVHEQFLRRHKL